MKKTGNLYTNLKIDIPTLRGVLIEKFREPNVTEWTIHWFDKNDELHSFNGFPSCINRQVFSKEYYLRWHKHGVEIKTLTVPIKSESEIIAEKLANKNFQERASKKK